MKTKRTKTAAIITIRDCPKMSGKGRKAIGKWLRKQAEYFEQYGNKYANRFTARYLYV